MQILLGLNHMHSKKILHRDIKTLNVFLDDGLNVKLGDMGVAKVRCDECLSEGEAARTLQVAWQPRQPGSPGPSIMLCIDNGTQAWARAWPLERI